MCEHENCYCEDQYRREMRIHEDCVHGEGACHSKLRRRYETKGEKNKRLEEYLSELKTEVQAVEEMIADLKR